MQAEPQPHEASSPMKLCPKCTTTKELKAFYPCKGRSDGHSSYCKTCSNTNRPKYKQSERKMEYRIVARAVARGDKPSTCPDCQNPRPPHLIRGRVDPGTTEIQWSCFACRTEALKQSRKGVQFKVVARAAAKKVKRYCTWCCDPFMTTKREQIYCSKACVWTWFNAKAQRAMREAQALNDGGEVDSDIAEEVFAEAHEEAMVEIRLIAAAGAGPDPVAVST